MELNEIILQLPGFIGWKNKTLHYLGCNNNLATTFGLETPDEIIGLNDNNLIRYRDDGIEFHHHNDLVALKGETIKCIHQPRDGKLFYFEKKPFFDKNNKIDGIIFSCHHITESHIQHLMNFDKNQFLNKEKPAHYYLKLLNNPHRLSNRELECLFYLIRGKSAKEIGLLLNLSKRTVEFYIENIKNKMSCSKKSELISIAMSAGYIHFIPSNFLNTEHIKTNLPIR